MVFILRKLSSVTPVTDSEFFLKFQTARNVVDLQIEPWQEVTSKNQSDFPNAKQTRMLKYTTHLNQIGASISHSKETQSLHKDSVKGQAYAIDSVVSNL